jgi:hypothetical protein
LAGDQRLLERFRSEELLPLGSSMRVRLALDRTSPEQLRELLHFVLAKAGAQAADARTPGHAVRPCARQSARLDEHGQRAAGEAAQREAPQLDEQLFFETYAAPAAAAPSKVAARRR